MSLREYMHIQPRVIKMLMNSFHNNRVAHAYLFEGEKGTKKKEIAIEFAKLMYCENRGEVCDTCLNCIRINNQNHPNVILIEAENGTIKKEQVLLLQKEYSKTTLEPGPKIYIVENIENMSINAANSLLKFIEEPREDTYTILTTDNFHQILPTIISRCQIINFQPVAKEIIINHLVENNVDKYIATICAHLTNDLEKALEYANDENIISIIDLAVIIGRAILSRKENLLVILENASIDIYKDKKLLEYFLDILLLFLRDVQFVKGNNEKIVFIHELDYIKKHIDNINNDKILYNINEILQAKINLEYNANISLLIDHLMINLM